MKSDTAKTEKITVDKQWLMDLAKKVGDHHKLLQSLGDRDNDLELKIGKLDSRLDKVGMPAERRFEIFFAPGVITNGDSAIRGAAVQREIESILAKHGVSRLVARIER